ncbi:alpha/beta hydrolase family protein [Labedella endophytica]|uniref:Alpha/beta fold hydrolase n=1 Tax=Labedella endophytica TaxID=1523160 RepID=A0A3S0VTC1_9MICO|nr:alpha/beta fold hydrolase [Labedella endophytica]RUR00752.1 alpha/beta fold hydrolase [Labedella endophytica]
MTMKAQRHAVRRQPETTRSSGVAAALAALAVTSSTAAAFLALVSTVSRKVVVPPRKRPSNSRILGVDRPGRTITLRADAETGVPGRYGLWVDGSEPYVKVGDILARSDRTVTRSVLSSNLGRVPGDVAAGMSGWFYRHPRELGVEYEYVSVPTPLGPAPAWIVPSDDGVGGDWVIQIHGHGSQRAEGLRAVPVFAESGFTSLLVSYRNDNEGPRSADGRYGLGTTEWRDVEAAIDFAVDRGAERIVLMGWSMGGAIALQTVLRSDRKGLVVGLVLDSPVVDWHRVLAFQATASHLPAVVRDAALLAIGNDWGRRLTGLSEPVDLGSLDVVASAPLLEHRVLILHSEDDGFVPSDGSKALAEARPDLVDLVSFHEARHARIWNFDEAGWNGAISTWLRSIRD